MKKNSCSQDLREILAGDILIAAQALLGKVLVHGSRQARIVEVEAYRADDDPGSHAYRGKTPRNSVMFGLPGHAYVYFNYGVHWMLNVVGHEEGSAAAILIRAAEPLAGIEEMFLFRPKAKRVEDLLSGPGKLAAAFQIDKRHNGIDLLDPHSILRLVHGPPAEYIVSGKRVGLSPGKGENLPWRFVDGNAIRFVSRPHPFMHGTHHATS